MKIEIELDDRIFTPEKFKEIENWRVKKMIAVKAGLFKISITDVIIDLVFRAAEIKRGGNNEKRNKGSNKLP